MRMWSERLRTLYEIRDKLSLMRGFIMGHYLIKILLKLMRFEVYINELLQRLIYKQCEWTRKYADKVYRDD